MRVMDIVQRKVFDKIMSGHHRSEVIDLGTQFYASSEREVTWRRN